MNPNQEISDLQIRCLDLQCRAVAAENQVAVLQGEINRLEKEHRDDVAYMLGFKDGKDTAKKEIESFKEILKWMAGSDCDACVIQRQAKEIIRLREILFCIGEMAVTSFDDKIVGIVDRTLNGFKIPEERFKVILQELLPKE